MPALALPPASRFGTRHAYVLPFMPPPESRVRHDLFQPQLGLDRGRSVFVEAAWYLVKAVFFLSALPWPRALKRALLRLFGARIGHGVTIKPRVSIHFPWKLEIGDHSWIGEEVMILNLEPVRIGAHCCLSQRAFLCTGNHDYRLPSMPFRNAAITVSDGAWVGAQCFIAPGCTIGVDAVATAGSVVLRDLPPRDDLLRQSLPSAKNALV